MIYLFDRARSYLYPVGNSTHALRVNLSTPWTVSGFFYKQIDPDDIYKTSDDVYKGLYNIAAIRAENPAYYKTISFRRFFRQAFEYE